MVLVFLDTEFHRARRGPRLLSLALVDGADEAYFELDETSLAVALGNRTPMFVRSQVLPQLGRLPNAAGPLDWISERTVEWLNRRQGETVTVHYDYATDYALLEQLVAAAKAHLVVTLHAAHVGYLLEEESGVAAAEACWARVARERGLAQHHALADALALQARFAAVHGL
jgi:hypothetical protein